MASANEKSRNETSVVGKAIDAVKQFASSISEAAHKAIEERPAQSDDEMIMMPPAPTGFMDEAVAPQPVVIRKRRESRQARSKAARPSRATAKKRAPRTKVAATRKPPKKSVRKKGGKATGRSRSAQR